MKKEDALKLESDIEELIKTFEVMTGFTPQGIYLDHDQRTKIVRTVNVTFVPVNNYPFEGTP